MDWKLFRESEWMRIYSDGANQLRYESKFLENEVQVSDIPSGTKKSGVRFERWICRLLNGKSGRRCVAGSRRRPSSTGCALFRAAP